MRTTLARSVRFPWVIVAVLTLCSATAIAQSSNIQIIPAPKQVTPGEGSFALARDTRITLADGKSTADRFAAEDFVKDVKETAGVSLSIGKGQSRRDILIGSIDSNAV